MNIKKWQFYAMVGVILILIMAIGIIIEGVNQEISEWQQIANDSILSESYWKGQYENILFPIEPSPEYTFESDDDLNWFIMRQLLETADSIDFKMSLSSYNGTSGTMIISWWD